MTDSPFFSVGDIVKITRSSWGWRELRRELPHQISDDMVMNEKPISRIAEVQKIYTKQIAGGEVRIYLLQFTSGHKPLEVTDEFMTQCALKISRSIFADTDEKSE